MKKLPNRLPLFNDPIWVWIKQAHAGRLATSKGEAWKKLIRAGLILPDRSNWTELGKIAVAVIEDKDVHKKPKPKTRR